MNPPHRHFPEQQAAVRLDRDGQLYATGHWRIDQVQALERQLAEVAWPDSRQQIWEMSGVESMDTAGAWLVERTRRNLEKQGRRVEIRGLGSELRELIDWVSQNKAAVDFRDSAKAPHLVEKAGRMAWDGMVRGFTFLSFLGESAQVLARFAVRPHKIRWQALFYNLKAGGFEALPIVGLLSFLMGVVIAYQAAVQLRPFGADVFIVDFVGISVLREIAPVITAIIVAGRSGSAYTAQIGTMTVTEEVDALRTMGMGPLELLVIPKVIALIIALPLLTVFADMSGVFGGMVIASTQLAVGFDVFLRRFKEVISATNFLIGIGKTPVFAIIIAVIGCYQGFRVTGSTESVGRQTTVSVVQSIFFVIVFDAFFSVLLNWMGVGLYA
jgi:phospholipid/cholesterol/gamma-HCH transport system permease protein